MKKAVIYARYSSNRQTDQSIEGQVRYCQDYAKRNNIEIVGEYLDKAISGRTDKRESFQQMIKDSKKATWECVLVYKLDRFSRNKYEMAIYKKQLENNNVQLISVTEGIPDSPEGKLLEALLEGMAEYYSVELGQKISRAYKDSLLKGKYNASLPPLGYYVKNNNVKINKTEALIVMEIFNKFIDGESTLMISQENKEKHPDFTPNMTQTFIHQTLKNEKYIGKYTYKGEIYTNIFPPIIPIPVFKAAQRRIEKNQSRTSKYDIIYILRELLICGRCGAKFIADSGTSASGTMRRYYRCSSRIGRLTRKKRRRITNAFPCNNITYKKEQLENIILDASFELFNNQNLNKFADMAINHYNSKISTNPQCDPILPEITKTDVLTFITPLLKRSLYCIYTNLIKRISVNRYDITITCNYLNEMLRPKITLEPTIIHTTSNRIQISPRRKRTVNITVELE